MQSSNRLTAADYLLIAFLVILAWLPSIRSYDLVADDYIHIRSLNEGAISYFLEHYNSLGVYRILGDFLNSFALNLPNYGFSILSLSVHVINSILFCVLVWTFTKTRSLSLLGGIFFGIAPFNSIQVVMWASAFHYAPAMSLFLIQIILIARYYQSISIPSWFPYFLFFNSVLICLTSEYLMFAVMGSGALYLACCRSEKKANKLLWDWTLQSKQLSVFFAPALAVVLFAITYKITLPEETLRVTAFNIKAVLSAIFYQYTAIDSYSTLLSSSSWGIAALYRSIASLAFIGAIFIYPIFFFRLEKSKSDSRNSNEMVIFCYILILLVGAASIWIFAGGYNLSTRAKYGIYPIWLLLLLVLVKYGLSYLQATKTASLRLLVIPLAIATSVTTSLNICINRYVYQSHADLVNHLAKHNDKEVITAIIKPNPEIEIPKWNSLTGDTLLSSENISIGVTLYHSANHPKLEISSTNPSHNNLIEYSPKSRNWD